MSNTTQEIAGPRDGITAEQIEKTIRDGELAILNSSKSYSDQKKITIEGFVFMIDKADNKQCAVTDCEDVTVKRCIFGHKKTLGQALNITGAKTKRVLVEDCIFEDMSFTESNGGEALRFGNSPFSGCTFECTIRRCIFRNVKSDPELISNKSCNNIVEDCFFLNNQGNVTVRHGGYMTVRHCYFKGTNGVRLHGYGNKVEFNCFDANPDSDKYQPVNMRYGNDTKDPNFSDVKTPINKAGKSHATYAQVVDNVIQNNEFKKCKEKIASLKGKYDLAPKNVTTSNNNEVEKFTYEVEVTPPPPPPPPPPAGDTCEVCGTTEEVTDAAHLLCKTHNGVLDAIIKAVTQPKTEVAPLTAEQKKELEPPQGGFET